jgi:hypothetical protein
MKAIAKCPKCGETITTTCNACIENETDEHHCCNGKHSIINGIKWKKIPENEKELIEVEIR